MRSPPSPGTVSVLVNGREKRARKYTTWSRAHALETGKRARTVPDDDGNREDTLCQDRIRQQCQKHINANITP